MYLLYGILWFWLGLLPATGAPPRREAFIRSPRVEVRAGPSTTYYATSTLQQGERIEILDQRYDYYEITPPPGSFSLVPVKSVTQTSHTAGMVQYDVETVVGSTDYKTILICRGVKLPRGYIVQILDRTYLHDHGRSEEMYKIIPPQGERRYVPMGAVEATGIEPVTTASYTIPQEVMHDLPPDLAQALQQADEAYKHGQRTGQWNDAEQQYQLLARSLHHSVKMLALNRLEFIKKQHGQPLQPINNMNAGNMPRRDYSVSMADLPPGSWQPQGTMPRNTLPPVATASTTGRSGTTSSLTSLPPNAGTSTTPTMPTNRGTTATSTPTQPNRANPNTTTNPRAIVGYLRPGYRSDAGQPLYYLTNSAGLLISYVTPQNGMDLHSYLGRTVEVEGTPLIHRADLNGKHMTVRSIRPLAQ